MVPGDSEEKVEPPSDEEETSKTGAGEAEVAEGVAREPRPWVKSVLAGISVILVAAAAGFGIGYATRSGDPGPDLSRGEAFAQSRRQTMNEVSRTMAKRGFIAGKRSGRSHGIIAGGMRAESAVTILVRQQSASTAQSEAASAQSELAGMAAAPAPPTPSVGDDG